jgi:hypothetical protein
MTIEISTNVANGHQTGIGGLDGFDERPPFGFSLKDGVIATAAAVYTRCHGRFLRKFLVNSTWNTPLTRVVQPAM